MIKKIKLPKTDPLYYCGNCGTAEQDGFVNALSLVCQHIKELKEIYLGQPEKVAILERLERRIAEDTK